MEERIVPYRYSRVIISIVLFVAVWPIGMAEEECMNDDGNPVEYCKPCSTEDGRQYLSGPAQAVYCYECDSRTDIRCADPFNFTLHQRDLPQLERCEGCCVKNVRMKGTPYESVWRTCTQKIQINLFMVDHVCMYESNSAGILCFCEEDYCNATTRTASAQLSLLGAFVLVIVTIKAHPWLIL